MFSPRPQYPTPLRFGTKARYVTRYRRLTQPRRSGRRLSTRAESTFIGAGGLPRRAALRSRRPRIKPGSPIIRSHIMREILIQAAMGVADARRSWSIRHCRLRRRCRRFLGAFSMSSSIAAFRIFSNASGFAAANLDQASKSTGDFLTCDLGFILYSIAHGYSPVAPRSGSWEVARISVDNFVDKCPGILPDKAGLRASGGTNAPFP